ncbi:MAG TPA: c-type cytochrome [Vicinamibacterales bacterium]
MRIRLLLTLSAAVLIPAVTPVGARGPGQDVEPFDGKLLFRTYCASCHGTSGRGDGPVAEHLRLPPADLTQIARFNRGVYPADRVARAIDGRDTVRAHGSSDMPVWGDAFSRTVTASDRENVRRRIEALVRYIATIQQKPAAD